jgi:selenocysteine-specific elongation factor
VKVVGTAGHIDHGKSTLVERLTGIDPDRLDEEKRRGMTIDLGFAWLSLPGGETISIVDVPGHERFVANMLAGAGGIDVALLVIAADESVMPQTREHVDILDLLGVSTGVVALTKSDLVDEDLFELVGEDVTELLSGTSLAGSPIVPVSAVTGQGVDELLVALDQAVRSAPPTRSEGSGYLPIDRVFTVSGFGTVVTGTLHDGAFRAGDELEILPAGKRARVRTLQTHSKSVDAAMAGSRVAANLVGIDRSEVRRGDVLAIPGHVRPARRFDARIRVVRSSPVDLRHSQEVSLHLGAGEYRAVVSVLGGDAIEPGGEGWVQIRSRVPVPAIRGQRFILRAPAPARTVAGGEVVDVRPRHRRGDTGAVERLEALVSGDKRRVVQAALAVTRAVSANDVEATTGIRADALRQALDEAVRDGAAVKVGNLYAADSYWTAIRRRAETHLEQYHHEFPLRNGITREELRRKLHRNKAEWQGWLDLLLHDGVVEAEGAVLRLPGFRSEGSARRDEAGRVLAVLSAHPFAPPSGRDLQEQARTDERMLAFMGESGEIVHVGNGVYFSADAYDRLVAVVMDILDRQGSVTMAEFRDAAGTTRKYAQAFLEHLDARRITRRQGDVRVRGRAAPACV